MVNLLSLLRRQERGTSLVEGLIAFPLVLLTYAIFIEIGFMMYTFNQNTKAVEVAARLAAVSDPLADLSTIDDDEEAALTAGDAIPLPSNATEGRIECTLASATCDSDGLERLIYGSDGVCDADAGGAQNAVLGMCDTSRYFLPENVTVIYTRSGLGYFGRPLNPVVSITVTLDPRTRGLFILDGLMSAFGADLAAIAFPSISVTVTSEDLSSTPL